MQKVLVDMFDKAKRKIYLEKFWKPYPAVVANAALSEIHCGRLILCETSVGQFELCFQTTDKNHQKILQPIHLKEFQWFEAGGGSLPNFHPIEIHLPSPLPLQVLKAGDWIQITGEKIQLLAPCLTETFLTVAQPSLYRDWIGFLNSIRNFFVQCGFDEIKTPTLVVCPGTEPFLEPFATEFIFGQVKQKLFLPTSPELSLKKCLARGWQNIFELRPCFRNGEVSLQHRAEFYMLEWYRSFANLEHIKADIILLLTELKFPGWQSEKLKTFSMAELFKKYLQFDLHPNTQARELFALACWWGLEAGLDWDFDDLFFLLYVEKIEPRLFEYEFLILEKYPPSQAALARLTPDGWGDRFEFYIGGIEIANAFNELNDPEIQRQRFNEDLAKKRKYHKTEIPLDEDFLQHLEQGMPPSAGIALGLERLFMAKYNLKDIAEIAPFY